MRAISWGYCLLAMSTAAYSADIAAHDAVISANIAAHDAANSTNAFSMAESVAVCSHATNKEQCCCVADTDSANIAAHLADSWQRCTAASLANASLHVAILWRCCFLALSTNAFSRMAASWQCCLVATLANIFSFVATTCHCHCSTIAGWAQHSCSNCRWAGVASHCCHRAVLQVRQIWRQRQQSQKKMDVAAAVCHDWMVRAARGRWRQAVSLLRSC
jgi:hypothetical protein